MTREDEIMARYLLKGGKMLSATCPACGCPLFEIRGKNLCVVCREREEEKSGKGEGTGKGEGALVSPAGQEKEREPAGLQGEGMRKALERAVINLCEKAAAEDDPLRAKILMEAVLAGVDAFVRLSDGPGQR